MPRRGFALALGFAVAGAVLCAQTAPPPTQTPVPKPFPGAQTPVSTAKPTAPTPTPAAGAQNWSAVDPSLAGVPPYQGAEFLGSFDAGRGQRLFVFGTNDDYAEVVRVYKTLFRKSGVEVSRTPRIQQFDFDRASFDSNTQQRPSVLVKDYAWPQPTDAYVHVAGTVEKRFRTLIQVIPATK